MRVSQGVKKSITVIQLIQAQPQTHGQSRPRRLLSSPTSACSCQGHFTLVSIFLSDLFCTCACMLGRIDDCCALAQFALLLAQALYGVFGAPYYRPRIVVELAIFQAIVFTCLFGSFYRCATCAKTVLAKKAKGWEALKAHAHTATMLASVNRLAHAPVVEVGHLTVHACEPQTVG